MIRRPQRSPASRVLMLSIALGAVSAVVYAVFLSDLQAIVSVDVPLGPVVLGVLFAASELMVVHLAARGEAYTVSLSEVPLVIGLALASPRDLLLARLIGAGLALLIFRRQPLRKLVVNVSLFAGEIVLAVITYRWLLGTSDILSWRGVGAALLAAMAAGVFGTLFVTAAMSLFSGPPTSADMTRALAAVAVTTTVNTAVGVGIMSALVYDAWLSLPLAGGAMLLYLLYRAYVTLSHRYEELEALHGFTEQVTSTLDLNRAIVTILASARQLLRCEQAWLLLPGSDGAGTHLVRDVDGRIEDRWLAPDEAGELLSALGPTTTKSSEVPHVGPVVDLGLKDVVSAPVAFDGEEAGMLVAANRLTEVSTFDGKDVRLLETLANQAGVALENGRLFGQLRDEADRRTHQALHDGLTGLPNRTQLDERFRVALDDARRLGHRVGILVIDLEGFKEVNDTLGHQTGDEVLKHVCWRLAEHVPEDGLLARFGGDEFVVLLPVVADEAEAVAAGDVMLHALAMPFRFEDLTLAVGARCGVALYPDHGTTPASLLQRADVAMYRAKMSATGVAVYAPEDDPFTPQRLAMAGELREAIGRGEIEVLFQPIIALRGRGVVGAEALVRWRHPQRGLLAAGTFVPVAERTGMIHKMTMHVLSAALAECRRWRELGWPLTVSVNLSVQNLLDPRLPGDLLDQLVAAGLPPEALVLELTESLAMTEVRRTLSVLSQLNELGVRLAIDDFGTGYSSLAYLRRLPVSELKIDRSFVHGLAVDDPGAAIVATIVELGHQLGLHVVAEGVESLDALDRLEAMGCDLGQGYVISPPRTAQSFGEWLDRQVHPSVGASAESGTTAEEPSAGLLALPGRPITQPAISPR